MTNEELIKEITSLPADAKGQIEKFIALLKRKRKAAKPDGSKGSFRDDPVFGMWKDREDMKEGGAVWVRKLREEQGTNNARPKPRNWKPAGFSIYRKT